MNTLRKAGLLDTTHLDQCISLHRNPDLDPATVANALLLKHFTLLIDSGGSHFGHPEHEISLSPQCIAQFVQKASAMKGYFEDEWARLQTKISEIETVWEQGRQQFPKDLAAATEHGEEITFSDNPDHVFRLYAEPASSRYWPAYDQERWFVNGYMSAWRFWYAHHSQTTNEELSPSPLDAR